MFGGRPMTDALGVTAGALVACVAIGGLVTGSLHGNRVVASTRSRTLHSEATLSDDYFRCLDVQARSLVSPSEPVELNDKNVADWVTLIQAAGSWMKIAYPPTPTTPELLLEHVQGPHSCLGVVVVKRLRAADGHVREKTGSGASIPGPGPPPQLPL